MSEGNSEARSHSVLLIDEDARLTGALTGLLEAHGYRVSASGDAVTALRRLDRGQTDLIMLDLESTPNGDAPAFIQKLRSAHAHVPVVAVTATGSIDEAVETVRAGAADYLPKPVPTDRLLASVEEALERFRAAREQAQARNAAGRWLEGIVGRSRSMQAVFQQITRIASSSAPVLITGETGTGKELIATALHRASGRDPLIPVNCGAIPDHLLESELFGHVRGAFTGADRDKTGLFEAAHGGTLFLDEIAELPIQLQAKLLRAVQSGEIRRVGEVTSRSVCVRLIAATHRNLEERVREGSFREDLYYRIKVLSLDVPPLRERTTDLALIAERHLASVAKREGKPELRIAPAALAVLVSYPWPGNVRELLNVIERAAVMTDTPEIGLFDLPEDFRGKVRRVAPIEAAAEGELTLAELEREYIQAILRRVGGNRTRAAQVLGVPRRTFYRRLVEYGIGSP
jgi:DNA-binding NtrC family response regulator